MKQAFLAAFALILALLSAAPARAERILSYDSDIAVRADGVLDVTETIRAQAEGVDIRHGIYRDFPTVRGGQRMGFTVVSVERDGAPEPWESSAISGGVRVRMGDPDRTVAPGEHVWRLRYTTTRQIGFFPDHDELYWNVTGNGWMFRIDEVQVRIRLPEPVRFGSRAVYTGSVGARGQDARVVSEQPGEIVLRTTRQLGSNEGLTVSVAWPKGVIARPGPRAQAWLRLTDRAGYITGGFGLLILLAFYLTAWLRVGRDPPAGTIVPLFTPPDGLSAAAMRYIVRMGMDDRTFAAALVDLGVRGRLRLVEGKKPLFGRAPMTIERNAAGAPASDASTTEDRMLDRLLLGSGRTITMTQENYKAFQRARTELETGFRTAYEDRLFVTNRRWALHGMALFSVVLCVTLSVILRSVPGSALFFYVALIVALFLAVGFIPRWFAAPLAARLQAIGDSIVLVGGGLLAFLLLPMAIGNALDEAWALAIPLLALPVAVTAFRWVEAPTRQGREVLDRIAGFRQYLSIAEEDRLARLNPPEKTPELFERYLPYAIALHVENAWADRFTGVLAAAQQAGTAMAWYSGHNSPWTQTGAFVGSVGSALSSSVASASSSPSSSGGGSSGGGGGGGGGGGW